MKFDQLRKFVQKPFTEFEFCKIDPWLSCLLPDLMTLDSTAVAWTGNLEQARAQCYNHHFWPIFANFPRKNGNLSQTCVHTCVLIIF
jgi:hypothetical protein